MLHSQIHALNPLHPTFLANFHTSHRFQIDPTEFLYRLAVLKTSEHSQQDQKRFGDEMKVSFDTNSIHSSMKIDELEFSLHAAAHFSQNHITGCISLQFSSEHKEDYPNNRIHSKYTEIQIIHRSMEKK